MRWRRIGAPRSAPAGQRDPSPAGRRRGGADRGALAAEPSVIEAWRGFRRAARARLDPAMPPGRAMIVPDASVAPTARAMRARARRAIYPSACRPSPPARGPSARRRSMCRPRTGAGRRSRGKARIARGSRADRARITRRSRTDRARRRPRLTRGSLPQRNNAAPSRRGPRRLGGDPCYARFLLRPAKRGPAPRCAAAGDAAPHRNLRRGARSGRTHDGDRP